MAENEINLAEDIDIAAAQAQSADALNYTPDDALRAQELEQVTGLPAPAIMPQVKEVDRDARRMITAQLVGQNKHLRDYVNAHPLNPVISSDDWATLDEVSQLAALESGQRQLPLHQRIAGAVAKQIENLIGTAAQGVGFALGIEGTQGAANRIAERSRAASKEALGESAARELDWWAGNTLGGKVSGLSGAVGALAPLAAATGTGGFALMFGISRAGQMQQEALERGASLEAQQTAWTYGFLLGTASAAIQFEGAFAVSKALGGGIAGWSGRKAIEAVKGMGLFAGTEIADQSLEWLGANLIYDPSREYKIDADQVLAAAIFGGAARGSLAKVEPYIREGQDVPYGLDRGIDALHEHIYDLDREAFEATYKANQKSTTRERNMNASQAFLSQFPLSYIAIDAEAVAKLYGEKMPEPEDGILGWVEDLKEQLEAASLSGGKIMISAADWHAKASPEVFEALKDNMSFRPGGPTKREIEFAAERGDLGETGPEPVSRDDAALRAVREQAGIADAAFARGDPKELEALLAQRAELAKRWEEHEKAFGYAEAVEVYGLEFEKLDKQIAQAMPQPERVGLVKRGEEINIFDEPFSRYELLDQNGRLVGEADLSLKEKDGRKFVYVDWVGGVGNYGPASFGTKLIKDLLRQVQKEFPEAEGIAGFRISGARKQSEDVFVAFDADEGTIAAALRGEGEFVDLGIGSFMIPEKLTQAEEQIKSDVMRVIDRVVPKEVAVELARGLVDAQGRTLRGLFALFHESDAPPALVVDLGGTDPVGTARHEAIHSLRRLKYFTSEEWDTLRRAALSEKWLEKFRINERYRDLSVDEKLEEAVAEGYRVWAKDRNAVPEETRPMFEKLDKLVQAVLDAVAKVLGKPKEKLTWEDIFEKVESGEIAQREPRGRAKPGAAAEVEDGNPADEISAVAKIKVPTPFGKSFGPETQAKYQQYLRLIRKRAEEDYEKALARAERRERELQSREWKQREIEVRREVLEDLPFVPTLAADAFFRNGDLYGKKVEVPKLGREFLNEEQLAALPKNYVSADGAHPDDFAGLFGFPNGDILVYHLAKVAESRKGMDPMQWRRKLVDEEVARVMEQRYGDFGESVLEAAKEQALSETQFQLLHQETLLHAEMAGQQFPIDTAAIKGVLNDTFQRNKAETQSSARYMQDAGKAARATEEALLKGDYQEAFRQKQRQFYALEYARRALDLEKTQKKFDKLAKRYEKREGPKSVGRDYINYVQQLLSNAGYRVKLSPEEIQASIDYGGRGVLGEFVDDLWSNDGVVVEVAPWLRSGQAKPVEQMTVQEYYDFVEAVQSLNHAGREAEQVRVGQERITREELRQRIAKNFEGRKERDPEKTRWIFWLDAAMRKPERILMDLDMKDRDGPFFNLIVKPFVNARNHRFEMQVETTKLIREKMKAFGNTWRKELTKEVPNDFIRDPYYRDKPLLKITREGLLRIMLNLGNEGNITKLVEGWAGATVNGPLTQAHVNAFRARLMSWVDQHATKQDWELVQHIWDLYARHRPQIDQLHRETTGVAPKWVEAQPIQTRHGEIKGGYFPIDIDKMRSPERRSKGEGLFLADYFPASTNKTHLLARTGAIDIVNITGSIEQALGRLQQVQHDLAFREFVINANKIINDREIAGMVRKYYGHEYYTQLKGWLKDVANDGVAPERELTALNDWLSKARFGLVAYALPWNSNVLLSPNIATANLLNLVRYSLANRSKNFAFAEEHSTEIKHMAFTIDRDFSEALAFAVGKGKLTHYQAKAIEWGYAIPTWVDKQFRVAVFMQEYNKALPGYLEKAKNNPTLDPQKAAAAAADKVIRQQFGAFSKFDLPAVMRKGGESMRLLTLMYSFFSNQWNWARDIPGEIRRGDYGRASQAIIGTFLITGMMNTLLFTQHDKDDPWYKRLAKGYAMVPLSWMPLGRDVANYFLEGRRQTSPILQAGIAAGDLLKDGMKAYQGKPVEKGGRHAAQAAGLIPAALGATKFVVPGGLQAGRTAQFIYDVAQGRQHPRDLSEYIRGILWGEARPKR